MKVRDFIKLDADIDVYDDMFDELGIAFCGSMQLTDAGKEKFAEVLDYDINYLSLKDSVATIHIDDADEKVWKRRIKKAREFFYAIAGYCNADDYDKWFISPGYGQYAINPDANVVMCVYCDTTPWFTEEEMNRDNLCDLSFPRELVRQYYESKKQEFDEGTAHELHIPVEDATFEQWLNDVCTADDTDGLYEFCKARGFIAVP